MAQKPAKKKKEYYGKVDEMKKIFIMFKMVFGCEVFELLRIALPDNFACVPNNLFKGVNILIKNTIILVGK